MAKLRVMISLLDTGAPARDDIVNTFYLDTDPEQIGGVNTDYDQLATDAAALWDTALDQPGPFDTVRCRIYNMDDPEPREPRADKTKSVVPVSNVGPRETALCLSYYADRNLPRKRGRMYIGPFSAGSMSERPSSTIRQQVAALGAGIGNLGGVDVDWVQYSPTTNTYSKVTNYYVDDEWDHILSRGLRATTRTTGTVDE